MRVLQINDMGYEAGGAEKSIVLIRDGLRRQGHESIVMATDKDSSGQDIFADELIPAIEGVGIVRLLRHFWYQAAYRQVRSVIRDFRPDIIHLHTVSEFSPSILWGSGRTPTVMTVHGPEEFTLGLLPWLLPPSDYKTHSYQPADMRLVGHLRYAYYHYLQRSVYQLVLQRLKLVIAPSQYMAQAITPDFPATQIIQIYNGINLPRMIPLPQTSCPTILYVGRLEVVKGVDVLIRALAELRHDLPGVKLKIVGDGSQRQSLKTLAQRLDLSKAIEFTGWVKSDSIIKQYATAQMLVIPSVWPENLPTVAIEALAIGRPIVGSNTGGIAELIDDGKNGFVVEAGDEKALAQAIYGILSDPDLLQSMAKASLAKSRSFDDKTFVDKLLNIYHGVLDENSAG